MWTQPVLIPLRMNPLLKTIPLTPVTTVRMGHDLADISGSWDPC